MKYEHNYYVNGFPFDCYNEARQYADFLLEWKRIYKCVFTKAEMQAMKEEDVKAYFDFKKIQGLGGDEEKSEG
jgi:hypothetical protein